MKAGVVMARSACRAVVKRRHVVLQRVGFPLLVVVLPVMVGSALLAQGIASTTNPRVLNQAAS